MANDTIKYPYRWMPLNLIKHALDKGYLKKEEIEYVIYASQKLKADTFKEVFTSRYERWGKASKAMSCQVIGDWNQQSVKTNKCAMTDSWDVAMAMRLEDENVNIFSVYDKLWLMRKQCPP